MRACPLSGPAQPLALRTSSVRAAFRSPVTAEFTEGPVLSCQELSPEMNNQAMARISLEMKLGKRPAALLACSTGKRGYFVSRSCKSEKAALTGELVLETTRRIRPVV